MKFPFRFLVVPWGLKNTTLPPQGTVQHILGLTKRFLGASGRFLSASEPFLGLTERLLGVSEPFLGASGRFLGLTERFLGASRWFLSASGRFLGVTKGCYAKPYPQPFPDERRRESPLAFWEKGRVRALPDDSFESAKISIQNNSLSVIRAVYIDR
jgi:hypothetical protein